MSSVKGRIIAEVRRRLTSGEDGPWLNHLYADYAAEADLAERLSAGQYVGELVIGPDAAEEQASSTIERYTFDFVVVVHLPPRPPAPASERPLAVLAADLHAAFIPLFCGPTSQGLSQTQPELARECVCLGGGGLALDDRFDTPITESLFRVRYAFARHDPTVPA